MADIDISSISFGDNHFNLKDPSKYEKPADGIPYSHLEAGVRTSLDKADSALQEHQSLSAYRTSAAQDAIDATKLNSASKGVAGGVAELDANGKVPAAQCPIEEDVAQATTDWLDEHVVQETGYVIDDSLTVSGAAADAKKTGDELSDLKSALENMAFEKQIALSEYTLINGSIYWNSRWYSSANQNYKSYAVPNSSYSYVSITAQETRETYVSFLKGDDVPVPVDGQYPNYCAGETNRHTISANTTSKLSVPQDCTWIVITQKHAGTVYTPNSVIAVEEITKIAEIDDKLDALEPLISEYPYEHTLENAVDLGELLTGYVRKDNGKYTSDDTDYVCTDYIPIIGSPLYMMVSYPYNDASGTAFYDANKNFLVGYGAEQLGAINTIVTLTSSIIPNNACYIRMSRRNRSSYKLIALYVPFLSDNVSKIAERFIENKTGSDQTNPLSEVIQTGGLYGTLNKVGIIGDSLAVGGMDTIGSQTFDPDVTKSWYSWPKILERMTGVETHVFAQGGYNTEDWLTTYGSNANFITNWCMAYIIGLGENDRSGGHHIDLGTESDVSTTSRAECGASYYGNLANIILRCKEAATNARIFILTNPRPEGESSGYNAAVRYVANAFGQANNVFLVDLYMYAHTIYAQYITDQNYWYGGHLTAIGYRMAAYHISTYIDWIIRTNPRAFRDIQFVTANA